MSSFTPEEFEAAVAGKSPKFIKVAKWLFNEEGGYVSAEEAKRRGDPGGETNLGISRRSYPNEDIANMTIERAVFLAHRDYWERIRGDELPQSSALVAMDFAFNAGPGRPQKALRRLVGLPESGGLTPQVMRRLARLSDKDISRYLFQERAEHLLMLSGSRPGTARGWSRRLRKLAVEAGSRVETRKDEHGAEGPNS